MVEPIKAGEPDFAGDHHAAEAKDVATDAASGQGRGLAYLAAVLGASSFSPWLWMTFLLILQSSEGRLESFNAFHYLMGLVVGAVGLVPFGIELARARGRRDLIKRAMIPAGIGLSLGLMPWVVLSSPYLLGLNLVLWTVPAMLGPLFGVMVLTSRHRRDDVQRRLLALLGIAPAITFILGTIMITIIYAIGSLISAPEVDLMKPSAKSKTSPPSASPER